MRGNQPSVDIAMIGTFSAWRLGTLQARALPFARELQTRGIRCAIVTVPWDVPTEAGVVDIISGVELRNTSATGVFAFPFAVAQQMRHIQLLQPQLVHVFKPKGYGGLAGWLTQRKHSLIVDSDDWEGDGGWNRQGAYSLPQRRLFQWQEQSLLRSATAVTAASHLLTHRARLLRGSTSPDTVQWIPNGLVSERLDRLRHARCQHQRAASSLPSIVLYSRFAEFPADWLPNYFTHLSCGLSADERVTVRVIGDATSAGGLYRGVNIDQMGYVAYETVITTLGSSDIALFPYADSLIARSKNSVKLLELMAAGCAIVASRVGDVAVVTHDTAVLVDGVSPEAFASATVELLRNPARVERLSKSARQRVSSQFAIASVVNRLVDTYRSAGLSMLCLDD